SAYVRTPALRGRAKGSRGAPYAHLRGRRRTTPRTRRATAGPERAPAQEGPAHLGVRRRLVGVDRAGHGRRRRRARDRTGPAAAAAATPAPRRLDRDLRVRDGSL